MSRAGLSSSGCDGCHAGHGEFEFVLQLPKERTQLAGDGNDDFGLGFAAGFEFDVTVVESVLHAP